MELQGKTAVVTGASKGIGYAAAEMLVQEGVRVIAVSRTKTDLEDAVQALLQKHGGEVRAYCADVSQESEIRGLASLLRREYGTVDILLNCAGVSQKEGCPMTEFETAELDRMIQTNFYATAFLCREIFPLLDHGGDAYIINILSTAAFQSGKGGGLYSASKYAARALTESLEAQCKGTPVQVCSVSPGPVNTNIWSHKTVPVPEERKKKMLRPEDIAGILRFLLTCDRNVHIGNITVEPWFYKK